MKLRKKRALKKDKHLRTTKRAKGTKEDLEILESLSREKILLALEKLKKKQPLDEEIETNGKKFSYRERDLQFLGSERKEMYIFPLADLDIDFKLVKQGITKIESIMKEESVNELTIHRKYLLEIFDADLVEISKIDGFPVFKPGVLECLEIKGIFTKFFGNVLKFFKVD